MNILEAVPAYGRDYTSRMAVLMDWNSNKDFQTDEGYVNKQQLPELQQSGIKYINIRYKCLSEVCVIKL